MKTKLKQEKIKKLKDSTSLENTVVLHSNWICNLRRLFSQLSSSISNTGVRKKKKVWKGTFVTPTDDF